MKISIAFGSNNVLTKDVPVGTTVGRVLRDTTIQAALGFGSNVTGHVCGVPQSNEAPLFEGAAVIVHNSECKKATQTASA